MSSLFGDLKHGLRALLKNPGYSLIAIAVLAAGIGANTAIFSVVNAVILRPLPFPDAGRIVRIWHTPPAKTFPGITTFSVSPANYLDWRAQSSVFEKMAIYSYARLNLTGTDHPEQITAANVSSDFFSVLQVQPRVGRTFTPDEDQNGRGQVVVLSHRFWQEHFGSNPQVVGQRMNLDGQSYLIVGVMPKTVRFPDFAEVWTPMAWTDAQRSVRGEHHYSVIARLKPGVELSRAQAEMNTISARLEQEYPADNKGWGAIAIPLHDDLVSDVRTSLFVMLGAVGFVLLIACANVANLVLARMLGRKKEMAIRTALGASGARLVRHVVAETLVLALIAGAIGVFLAHLGLHLIVAMLGDRIPRSAEIELNLQVLAFTVGISVIAGVVAGLLPAVRVLKTNLNDALKQGFGRTDSDGGSDKTRSALVAAEVALTLVLVIGAGLMVRSLFLLRRVDPGFQTANLLTMSISIPATKFPTPAQEASFFDRVLEQVRGVPGVESAGLVDDLPLQGGSHQPIAIEGQPAVPMAEQPEVDVRVVSPGYLPSVRVPFVRGRDFNQSDIAGRPPVVVISQSIARRFWPNQDPIGKRLTLTFFPGVVREVIGVVGDVKTDGLDQNRPMETLYWPLPQVSGSGIEGWSSFPMNLVVRTTTRPTDVASAVIESVHRVDRDVPLLNVATMDEVVSESMSSQRLNMQLLASFAALALLLAAAGTYSVLSYTVRRRVREIGIRMALGAKVNDVLRLVVIQGMRPTLIGVFIGLVTAAALNRVLANLTYGVKPLDPVTFMAVPILLAGVGLLASLIPAYRASRIDPMKILRDE